MTFIANVSVAGNVVHAVGPFATYEDALREGRLVGDAVNLFAPVGADDADVSVRELRADLADIINSFSPVTLRWVCANTLRLAGGKL